MTRRRKATRGDEGGTRRKDRKDLVSRGSCGRTTMPTRKGSRIRDLEGGQREGRLGGLEERAERA